MSAIEIDKLTPEQEALISVYRDKWRRIALSTEPVDRDKATEAVKAAYNWIGEEKPEIIFFDSPIAITIHLDSAGYSELDNEDLLPKIWIPGSQWQLHRDEELWDIVEEMRVLLCQEIQDKIEKKVGELYVPYIPTEFEAGAMQTDVVRATCGWAEFCIRELNLSHDQIQWEIYEKILASCGLICAYQEACLICDRPRILSLDSQKRLHAENGPAIQFADGFSLYAERDVVLPEKCEQVDPQQWQIRWILQESDTKLRQFLIKDVGGYDRLCQELEATELDTWQEYTLLKISNKVALEPIHILKITDSSGNSIRFLRVPPDITSAREAIGWVNWGIDPEEFAIQT